MQVTLQNLVNRINLNEKFAKEHPENKEMLDRKITKTKELIIQCVMQNENNMRVKIEDLQKSTIDRLRSDKENYQDKIEEFMDKIEELKKNISDIDSVLEEKEKIKTHNIVEVIKSKFWMRGSETEIEIYVKAVADNDERQFLNRVAFRRLKYSDRTMLYDTLNDLYKEYGFTKIVCDTMTLTKKICSKFEVVESL